MEKWYNVDYCSTSEQFIGDILEETSTELETNGSCSDVEWCVSWTIPSVADMEIEVKNLT